MIHPRMPTEEVIPADDLQESISPLSPEDDTLTPSNLVPMP